MEIRAGVRENKLRDPSRVTIEDVCWFVDNPGIFVSEAGEKIVGFSAADPRNASIFALFVEEDYEGRGIGQALFERACGVLVEARSPRMWLTTWPGTRAEQFYRRAGWRVVGTDDGNLVFERETESVIIRLAAAADRAHLRQAIIELQDYERLQHTTRLPGEQVADAYVPYMEATFAYFENQSVKLFGRDIKQVLLLHANAINADHFKDIVAMLQKRGYKFITLQDALSDKAYASPDTFTGPGGISWLDRWAMTRNEPATFFAGEPYFVGVDCGGGEASVEICPVRWRGGGLLVGRVVERCASGGCV